MKREDAKKIEFEGKEYTKYELSQIQRKTETAIRHAKDRQIIAKASGDDTLRRQEQERINLLTRKYAKLCKESGLPTKTERMSVGGYHRVKSTSDIINDVLTTGKNSANIRLSNKDVRKAYKNKVASISEEINRNAPLEDQAREAFDKRNKYRSNARSLMADEETRKLLDKERPNKSFDELIDDKMKRKGLTREEAVKDILETATKTNKSVDDIFK